MSFRKAPKPWASVDTAHSPKTSKIAGLAALCKNFKGECYRYCDGYTMAVTCPDTKKGGTPEQEERISKTPRMARDGVEGEPVPYRS